MADASPNTQGQFDQTAANSIAGFTQVAQHAAQNAVANQQAMNALGLSIVARNTDTILNLQPAEAQATVGVLTSGLSGKLAELGTAVAAIQQSLKGAQTTPPETGKKV